MTATTAVHGDLGARWHAMSLVEQLGNVGSDVARAIRAHESGHAARFEAALSRALELFDLSAADPRWRGARRREILRAREEFCRIFFDGPSDPVLVAGLERYFRYFAVAANTQRAKRSA
jgi:hypothetical protein